MMAKMRGEAGAWQAARHAYRRVLELYPQNPPAYVELAEVEAEAGVALHDHTWLRSARTYYVRALQLDDARAPGELRRFNPEQRAAIQAKIARLENLLVDQ
jgi:tetratricopeptide (TPR) repeat protein